MSVFIVQCMLVNELLLSAVFAPGNQVALVAECKRTLILNSLALLL